MHKLSHLILITALTVLVGCQSVEPTKPQDNRTETSRNVEIPLPVPTYFESKKDKNRSTRTLAIPADNIKVSALTRVTALPTNSIFIVSTIGGGSSNTYGVALETMLNAGMTNGDYVITYNSGGFKRFYVTNLVDQHIAANANIAASKLDTNVVQYTDINTQVEFENRLFTLPSGGGSALYVGGSQVNNANLAAGSNMFFVAVSTNVYGFPTNLTAAQLLTDSVSADELNASGVRDELEAVLRLPQLQSAVTDSQVPNNITIDLATLATTATTANGVANNSVTGAGIALTSQATGTVMYYNGTDWVVLTIGTAGQVLKVNSGATAPEWGTDATAAGGESAGTVHAIGTAVLYQLSYFTNSVSTNISPSKLMTDATGTNLYAGGIIVTGTLSLGDGATALLETWPVGGMRTNAGSNVGITNYLFEVWNSNATFNADLLVGNTNVAGALEGKSPNASDTALAGSWNGVTTIPPSKNAIHDYVILGDPDLDGFPSVFDPTGTAGWMRVNSSGVAQTPLVPGTGVETAAAIAVNATGGFRTVGTRLNDLIIQRPDYGDGAGAVPQTNTYTASGLMHYTMSGNAETNANWVVYEFPCPPDFNTGADPTIRISFLSGGTDSDNYVFHVTHATQAAGAAYVTGTSISTLPIVVTVTPTTPASGDLQQSAATTLTGWGAVLVAGQPMQIRVARLQNTQDDSSRTVSLTFGYTSTR